jgi:TolB-like protein/DNA-binding winged helix-turn-helix (wHTH) protein
MEGEFYISDWHVDVPGCVITREGVSVKLEPKVMDLLVHMSGKPEHVHSREELLDNVWPGTVVSDEALTNAVIKLRKVFEDDSHNPRMIKTIPKRGYCLIAEVRSAVRTQPDIIHKPQSNKHRPDNKRGLLVTLLLLIIAVVTGWYVIKQQSPRPEILSNQPNRLALPEKPSIAVLPFMNIGNEGEQSYFSDGITDDLITDLSKLTGMFVISRNSTFQYKGRSVDAKQVASELGVHYVLEGSVRRIDDRVRVNAQLIDGRSGLQIWADRYDGVLRDVFDLQDRITGNIITALAVRVTTEDRSRLSTTETTNIDAYDEFLKGKAGNYIGDLLVRILRAPRPTSKKQ